MSGSREGSPAGSADTHVHELRPRWILGLEPPPLGKVLRGAVVLAAAGATLLIPEGVFTPAAQRMLFIAVLTIGLWVTEIIEPYATALLAMALQIVLLGLPGGPLGFDARGYVLFLEPLASPVIVLLLGGFVLTIGLYSQGLHLSIAGRLLRPFGETPSGLLLGVLVVTAGFSMWMSNTATTAMMLAVIGPIMATFPKGHGFRTALVLGTAFSANLGGMGTIIGTPPNAIAVITLAQHGILISFGQWMLYAVPLVFVLVLVLWRLLLWRYPAGRDMMEPWPTPPVILDWRGLVVVVVFVTCVMLWITEALHGLPPAVVALIPVVAFAGLRVISPKDLGRVDWPVLFLVAGGISVGQGMRLSGLAESLIGAIPFGGVPVLLVIIVFLAVTMTVSSVMSNSATAALVVPLAVSVAVDAPLIAAMVVALAASTAMVLPVSTPPNALAFYSGAVSNREMMRTGALISSCALAGLSVLAAVLLLLGATGRAT